MSPIEYLKVNSNWLKDVSTLVLTTTGTIIAILTYKRAKATIFQPKRVEVIKIQSQILIDFLSSFTTDGNSLDKAIDYFNLLYYNFNLVLRKLNIKEIEQNSEIYKELNLKIGGWYEADMSGIYDSALIEGSLEDYDEIYSDEALGGSPTEQLINEIYLDQLFVSKKHSLFVKKLRDICNNPFLPNEILDVARQIGENMTSNFHVLLKGILIEKILPIKQSNSQTGSTNAVPNLDYIDIWNEFETKRIKHNEDYMLLRKKIREHLRIDDKW